MKKGFHYITNPFAIYGITWLLVITIYNLKWSDWYPSLSSELCLFIYITAFFSFITAYVTQKTHYFEYKKIKVKEKEIRIIKRSVHYLYLLLFIEFLLCKQIPLLSILLGTGNYAAYQEFGLPIVHVLTVSGFIFIYAFAIYCYINSTDQYKKTIKSYIILCLLCGILIVNRALFMHMFCIGVFIFIMSKKKIFQYLIKIGIISIIVFFLFGTIGNLRNSDTIEAGKEYIMNVGNASTKFRDSNIPVEFFWGYLYITSPLSNVQYTINHNAHNTSFDNLFPFIVNQTFPQMISKRIGVESKGNGLLITDNLNVGSLYLEAYAEMGWIGMWIIFFFMFPFVWFTFKLIPKGSLYYIPSLAIINTIITFNIFNNMFIFSGIVPSLYFPVIFSLLYRRKKS